MLALTQALSEAVQNINWHGHQPISWITADLSAKIVGLLQKHPGYQGDEAKGINTGNGLYGIQPTIVLGPLILHAKEWGAEEAVKWFGRIFEKKKMTVICVVVLQNIKVDETIDLTEEIKLMPSGEFHPSLNLHRIISEYNEPNSRLFGQTCAPTLLVSHVHLDEVVVRMENTPTVDTTGARHRGFDRIQLMIRVSKALSMIGPSGPVAVSSWTEFEDPDLQPLSLNAVSRVIDEIAHRPFADPIPIPSSAGDDIKLYLGLSGDFLERIDLALLRLNVSGAHPPPFHERPDP
jgi:hypothetical protein